jgi:hypothetical protein
MSEANEPLQVTSIVAGLTPDQGQAPLSSAEHHALDVFIGKWLTVGHTIERPGVPSVRILASDVYEWVPGHFFVLHSAYGRIGDFAVGAIEMLWYDPAAGHYRSQLFDSQGNVVESTLTLRDGVWTWARENTRCFATFSDDGSVQTAHHERSDDAVTWQPNMDVTLTKVE